MPPPNDLQNIPDEPSSSSAAPSGEQTFISHLIELRSRLLRAIACVGAVLLCMLVPNSLVSSYSRQRRQVSFGDDNSGTTRDSYYTKYSLNYF